MLCWKNLKEKVGPEFLFEKTQAPGWSKANCFQPVEKTPANVPRRALGRSGTESDQNVNKV